jgi:hypothetical protein
MHGVSDAAARGSGDQRFLVWICQRGSLHEVEIDSVLTVDLIDEPGEPIRAALDRVLEMLRARLLGSAVE